MAKNHAVWAVCAVALALASCGAPTGDVEPSRSGLLVLLTDFGERDHYVGALKGAAYRANPLVRIESITHQVEPFDIWEGALTLGLAAREFPPGTVFVAVVDPGVGTARKALALRTEAGRYYVAPDNGLLTFVARREGIAEVRDISALEPLGRKPSRTFQGRDLFAPAGALLAGGTPLARLGPRLAHITLLPIPEPAIEESKIEGAVLRIDRYGNIVTNVPAELVAKAGFKRGETIQLRVGAATIQATYAATYGDVPQGQPLCLVDSLGYLELAINQGNLAQRLGTKAGMPVEITRK